MDLHSVVPSSGASVDSPEQGLSSEWRLVERARKGSQAALGVLFGRYAPSLRRWARGRLPRVGRGLVDTSDLVQDALWHTMVRLARFEPRHTNALRAYLRRAVENRIRDEMRRALRRPTMVVLDESVQAGDSARSPLQQVIDNETWARYRAGLKRLTPRERRMIVGRAELGYSFRQLALVEGQSSPDAARMALRRALIKLGKVMPGAERSPVDSGVDGAA